MRLKELREEKKISQNKLSKELNVNVMTYNGWEKEKVEPSIEKLKILADYYNVSLDYLVGRQFVSDVGYLTKDEKNILEVYRQMTEENKEVFYSEGRGILLAQGLKN